MVLLGKQRILRSEKPMVIVDTREDQRIKEELEMLGIKVIEKNLDVGDFIVSEKICFERKSFTDFIRSIVDKRLFEQISKMEKSFEKPILVIEGFDESLANRNVIFGAIAFILSKTNSSLIFTESIEDTAKLIAEVAKKEQFDERTSLSFVRVKKILGKKGTKEFVLSSFPGIGQKTARKLLEKFRSLENVFNASISELVNAGLSKKRALEFKKLLRDEEK